MQTSAFAYYPVAVKYYDEIVMGMVEKVKKKSQAVGGSSRFHACVFFWLLCALIPFMIIGFDKQNHRKSGVILSDRRESKDLRTNLAANVTVSA